MIIKIDHQFKKRSST